VPSSRGTHAWGEWCLVLARPAAPDGDRGRAGEHGHAPRLRTSCRYQLRRPRSEATAWGRGRRVFVPLAPRNGSRDYYREGSRWWRYAERSCCLSAGPCEPQTAQPNRLSKVCGIMVATHAPGGRGDLPLRPRAARRVQAFSGPGVAFLKARGKAARGGWPRALREKRPATRGERTSQAARFVSFRAGRRERESWSTARRSGSSPQPGLAEQLLGASWPPGLTT